MSTNNTFLNVNYTDEEIPLSDVRHAAWSKASPVDVTHYWSGERAPETRSFRAWLLWSDTALYVKFVAPHFEPPVVAENPDLTRKTIGLWERDVLEIFVAPDKTTPNKYYEFEIAPTGEWIDLRLEITPEKRITDLEYSSEMKSFSTEVNDSTVSVIKVPFESLGQVPNARDVWLGNLFRCIGKDPSRGYLSWRPTKTEKPNFHVPDAFGEFRFVK